MTPSYFIEKATRRIRRAAIAVSPSPRKGSYPYVSGDTFREWADVVYEPGNKCEAKDITEGSTVFLSGEVLEEFFLLIHPFIKGKYKIITHNSDHVVGEAELKLIDDKIIRWFAQNNTVPHPKVTPIPIALESLSYSNAGRLKHFKDRKVKVEKKNHILVGFNVRTNPTERTKCLEAMKQTPLSFYSPTELTQKKYVELLKTSRAVVSPPGNGEDCHRTWEAVFFGTVPIVKRSHVTEYFAGLGLPVWIVDDYEELAEISEKDFVSKCEEIISRSKGIVDNLLSYHYWQGVIRAPEESKDEAIVCIATGEKYLAEYEKYFKKCHEELAFNIRRPLIVISESVEQSEKHPSWQKLLMFKSPITKSFERVMLLDGDIFIEDPTKNPFDLVPQDHWGLVPNNAFNLPNLVKTDPILYEYCPPEDRPNDILNCGFFIVSKSLHQKILEQVFYSSPEQPCYEQGPLNYYLRKYFAGTVLPFSFNNITSAYIQKFGYRFSTILNMRKESYFLHFAGKSNMKILSLFLMFKKYPILVTIVSFPPIRTILDALSKIVKKIKRIDSK